MVLQIQFQSPHYRGSPFGVGVAVDRLTICPVSIPSLSGQSVRPVDSGFMTGFPCVFQSPHYRGSPFGAR